MTPQYEITYTRDAAKAFRRIHPEMRKRIRDAIEALSKEPRPSGALQLTGGAGEYRIRVGDYRIIYTSRTTASSSSSCESPIAARSTGHSRPEPRIRVWG